MTPAPITPLEPPPRKASLRRGIRNVRRAYRMIFALVILVFGGWAATGLGAAATALGAAVTALGVAGGVCACKRAPQAQAITRTSAAKFFIDLCRVSPSDATCQ